MATRFSWKRGKSYDGLRRMPNSYHLQYGGKILAVAQEQRDGVWFWYGGGVNTSHRCESLGAVKVEAVNYFKAKQKTCA